MSPLPIFFIHRGDHFYLRCSLIQARQFNPQSQIYVLGDHRAKRVVDAVNPAAQIEFAFLEDYLPTTNQKDQDISQYYFHISPNSYEGELFCIQRWFALDRYLQKYRIVQCFYLDSDVLLYTKIDSSLKAFSAQAAGIFWGPHSIVHSLHTSYFTCAVLHDFCCFMLDVYKSKRNILEDYIEETGYHISDMSLALLFFRQEKYTTTIDLLEPRQEEGDSEYSVFDERVTAVDGFEYHHQLGMPVKKIIWAQSASGGGVSSC